MCIIMAQHVYRIGVCILHIDNSTLLHSVIVCGCCCFAQSKDEEIAKLNYRILQLTRALDARDALPK